MESDRRRRIGNSPGGVPDQADDDRLHTLKKRSDFLKAARADRLSTPGFNVQARKRTNDEGSTHTRVGYTCSKKVGHAVARNRAKRRLREIARMVLTQFGRPDCDYVLIGRHQATADRNFDSMCTDLKSALQKLHAGLS
jgi:ribonuclease P protein component